MIVSIIGLGLIGGSIAIDLRKRGFANSLLGMDANTEHAAKALELGLVDSIVDHYEQLRFSDIIILAVPVDAAIALLNNILPLLDNQLLIDVGSTKEPLINAVNGNEKRHLFLAAHPMAGTEFSGPQAAISGLFDQKAVIFCNAEETDTNLVYLADAMFAALKMRRIDMDAKSHDIHAAYVSHISHISSFALALSVLHKEKDERSIFEMASGGFASTVRLAKSSPDMWAPIFMQNRKNVLEVLDTYINYLYDFKLAIFNQDKERLLFLMNKANDIKPILNLKEKLTVKP